GRRDTIVEAAGPQRRRGGPDRRIRSHRKRACRELSPPPRFGAAAALEQPGLHYAVPKFRVARQDLSRQGGLAGAPRTSQPQVQVAPQFLRRLFRGVPKAGRKLDDPLVVGPETAVGGKL